MIKGNLFILIIAALEILAAGWYYLRASWLLGTMQFLYGLANIVFYFLKLQ